jgi:hypothetical protein
MSDPRRHWLTRTATVRKLWCGFILLLGLTLLAGLWVQQHQLVGLEDRFGFYGGYGFLVCVLLVALAKLLGRLLKRPDHYYLPPPRSQAPPARSAASREADDG